MKNLKILATALLFTFAMSSCNEDGLFTGEFINDVHAHWAQNGTPLPNGQTEYRVANCVFITNGNDNIEIQVIGTTILFQPSAAFLAYNPTNIRWEYRYTPAQGTGTTIVNSQDLQFTPDCESYFIEIHADLPNQQFSEGVSFDRKIE